MPLERDEGEYGYAGQLILQGVPPYQMAYNMKLPGTYAAYAAIMALLGQTPRGIRIGLLLVNAFTIVLVFALGRRLFDSRTGLFAAAAYAVTSTSQSFLGVFAHASHFIVLPALAGLLLVEHALDSGATWKYAAGGGLLGLALLMKQHGVFLIAFAAFWIGWRQVVARTAAGRGRLVPWAAFALGVSLPAALMCVLLLATGTFGKFWFWTVLYAREYASVVPLSVAVEIFPSLALSAIGSTFFLWILAGTGVAAVLLDRTVRSRKTFVLVLALASFLTVCPGFYFRSHYFIVMLPSVALLSAIAVTSAGRLATRAVSALPGSLVSGLLFAAAAGHAVWAQRDFLFRADDFQASRMTYGANPFPEALEIGRYIRTRSGESETIAVIGSEPEIYFYSGRRSATGYIYTYGLMESQRFASTMQEEMIREIEAARPRYMVCVVVFTSWLKRPTSDTRIFTWQEEYARKHYDLEGVVDILSEEKTEYRWGRDAAGYNPRSDSYVIVYRRRDTPR